MISLEDMDKKIEHLTRENKKLTDRIKTLEKYREEPYTEAVRLQNANCKLHREKIMLMEEIIRLEALLLETNTAEHVSTVTMPAPPELLKQARKLAKGKKC